MASQQTVLTDEIQASTHLTSYKSSIVEFPYEYYQTGNLNIKFALQRGYKLYKSIGWYDFFCFVLPCLKWLGTYNIQEYLLADLISGISVACMVIPQGMSYANSAGLPSAYGLYGAFVPLLVYSCFGSCRHLSVGPVAVTSLLIASNLKGIIPGAHELIDPNNPDTHEQFVIQALYNQAAIQLALLVSCFYTAVGVFRLGFLSNFFSHSVIGGFTSGAAVIIGSGQLQYLLGFPISSKNSSLQSVLEVIYARRQDLVWQELLMGSLMLCWLLIVKELSKRHPHLKWMRQMGPISACINGLALVCFFRLDEHGIRVVKHIHKGLPHITTQWWFPMTYAPKLVPVAVVVMLVDLLESTSIARVLAQKNGYKLNWNQEIIGLGLANLGGACFNAYTTTGSFSRSSVNEAAGAKTNLAGCFTAITVMLVMMFLTPVFEKMPYNTMGAIVLSAVVGLVDLEQAKALWKINKLDFAVWLASFLGVVFWSVELGLGISMGMAVLIAIWESAFPKIVLLARVPGTPVYRNVKQYPESRLIPGVLAVRIDAALYFANVHWVRSKLDKYIAKAHELAREHNTTLRFFILDATPMGHMDVAGLRCLEDVVVDLAELDISFLLVNPCDKVLSLLKRAAFVDLIGRDRVFVRMQDAVSFCHDKL